jgi:aminoglycoside 6'-N-acetyltransferase I
MRIIDLTSEDEGLVRQVAAILVAAFREHWPTAWPDEESALEEVRESFGAERISRVAVGENEEALGWIGGISEYDGMVWELHPLVVDPTHQRQGIGRALVADFEQQVRQRGGLTITLGSDDENDMTTLSGVDLYPNVWEHIARIKNLKRHPYEFYQKLGYAIVGVVAKRVSQGLPLGVKRQA